MDNLPKRHSGQLVCAVPGEPLHRGVGVQKPGAAVDDDRGGRCFCEGAEPGLTLAPRAHGIVHGFVQPILFQRMFPLFDLPHAQGLQEFPAAVQVALIIREHAHQVCGDIKEVIGQEHRERGRMQPDRGNLVHADDGPADDRCGEESQSEGGIGGHEDEQEAGKMQIGRLRMGAIDQHDYARPADQSEEGDGGLLIVPEVSSKGKSEYGSGDRKDDGIADEPCKVFDFGSDHHVDDTEDRVDHAHNEDVDPELLERVVKGFVSVDLLDRIGKLQPKSVDRDFFHESPSHLVRRCSELAFLWDIP
ncbi:MAG: hypothetical protein M0042_09780 [Nitrospiraceae bacterium]|nr:hypothetical protein [Nitrospiraceae bacterium]